MALQGDLKTMRLDELMQWLYQSEATGRLMFRHPSADIVWYVAAGQLVDVDTPGLDLWAEAKVGAKPWAKAKAWAEREGTTPLAILERVGLLDTAEVPGWIQAVGKRSLHTMMLWEQGWFLFEEMNVEGRGVPIEHLLLDAAREWDERDQLKQRFGDAVVWIEAAPGREVEGVSDAVAALLRGGVHLVELPWLLSEDAWEVTQRLNDLVAAGSAVLVPVDTPDLGDPLRAYQEALVAERSFRYEDAAASFEDAITAAWSDTFAREAVARWMERYMAMVAAHLLPPDRYVAPAAHAVPEPGDPYAAYILRVVTAPVRVADLLRRAPFHRFYVVRSLRRLAACGKLHVLER